MQVKGETDSRQTMREQWNIGPTGEKANLLLILIRRVLQPTPYAVEQ